MPLIEHESAVGEPVPVSRRNRRHLLHQRLRRRQQRHAAPVIDRDFAGRDVGVCAVGQLPHQLRRRPEAADLQGRRCAAGRVECHEERQPGCVGADRRRRRERVRRQRPGRGERHGGLRLNLRQPGPRRRHASVRRAADHAPQHLQVVRDFRDVPRRGRYRRVDCVRLPRHSVGLSVGCSLAPVDPGAKSQAIRNAPHNRKHRHRRRRPSRRPFRRTP